MCNSCHRVICVALLTACALAAVAQEGKQPLSFTPVPNHQAVKPGEHPRLLFRKSDLPEIRRRAKTPEGKQLVERLRATLGGGHEVPTIRNPNKYAYDNRVSLPEGAYSITSAAGFGMLYQLTDDTKYAQLARECIELGMEGVRDRDDNARYALAHGHGELRVGPTLGWTAVAYDLCYDAWSPDFRKTVADYLLTYEQLSLGKKERLILAAGQKIKKEPVSLKAMARDPRHHPSSNHFGSITGGTGMVLLALLNDPEADQKLVASYLESTEKNAVAALGGFGQRGFFFEGQGPSHMGAYPIMISFFRALKNVTGRDYISDNDNMQWISLRWIGEATASRKNEPVYLARTEAMGSSYGSDNLLASGSMSSSGRFSLGFSGLPEEQKPYLLWMYNNYFKASDPAPFDTLNYPHFVISALAHWPIGVPAKHPQGTFATAYRDEHFGHYVFRSGWTGTHNEAVVTAFTARRGGTRSKPWKSLPLKIQAHGRKHEIDLGWKQTKVSETSFVHEGQSTSVSFSDGTILATDFSDRSGATGVLVLRRPKNTRVVNSGYFPQFMHHHFGKVNVLTINADNHHPAVQQVGDAIQVGGLLITATEDGIRFAAADTALGTIDSYAARGIDPAVDTVTPETLQHPGTPDALLTFDYEDFEQRGDNSYWREAEGRGEPAYVYNLRPEHLVPGISGQALPVRSKGLYPSILAATDSAAEAKIPHPLGFDGIKSAVMLPDHERWSFGPDSQTITFWVKFLQPKGGASMLVEPVNMGPYHMGFHGGPTVMMTGKAGGVRAPFPNAVDEWQMVTLVFDEQRRVMTYFVNGELAARSPAKPVKEAIPGPTIFNGRQKGSQRYPEIHTLGDFDELAMYERALTAGEVMALYEDGQARLAANEKMAQTSGNHGIGAYIDVDRAVGAAPLAVNFSTKRSIIGTPSEASYAWDFGDGTSGTGANPQHTYTDEGVYPVTLTISAGSHQSTASYDITVANRPPVVAITTVSQTGNSITLSAAESHEPDGQTMDISWEMGGQRYQGAELSLKDLAPGSYIIQCSARDSLGAQASRQTVVSIPDGQGYRHPENPTDTVPGLHYAYYKLHKKNVPTGKIGLTDSEFLSWLELDHVGAVSHWAAGLISPSMGNQLKVFSGYIDIPENDTYTIHVNGVNRLQLMIGTDFSVMSEKPPGFQAKTIKLRRGKHLIRMLQTGKVLNLYSPRHHTMGQIIFEHSDGRRFLANSREFVRSQVNRAMPSIDYERLGVGRDKLVPKVSGNRAPQVTLSSRVLSEMLGAKRIEMTATISDPDGDSTTATWFPPDGGRISGVTSVARLLTAGTHIFAVEVDDGRGGVTTAQQIVTVAGPDPARSISIDFTDYGAKGHWAPVFPGDRAGLVPSAQWNMIQTGPLKKTTGLINTYPGLRIGMKVDWFDSDGFPQAIQVSFPELAQSVNPRIDDPTQYNLNNPNLRLFTTGIRTPKMVIEDIPYASYDVLVYVIGNGFAPMPPALGAEAAPADSTKRKHKSRMVLPPVLSANDQQVTVPRPEINQVNGTFTILSDSNPTGTVVRFEGLRGATCTLALGVDVGGIQIVEKK